MLPVDLRGIWKTLPPESEVSICLLLSWVKMVVALPSSYGLSLGSLLGNWEDKQGDPDLGSAWPWWALSPSGCHLSPSLSTITISAETIKVDEFG